MLCADLTFKFSVYISRFPAVENGLLNRQVMVIRTRLKISEDAYPNFFLSRLCNINTFTLKQTYIQAEYRYIWR